MSGNNEGKRVRADENGKLYYVDGYPDSKNQNLDVADKSGDQPVNEEGIKLEFDDPTETQNPEVLDGESLVDEIQKVAGKGAEEKQEEKKFNSEGLLKEIQEVHRGSQIDLDEPKKNETKVDPEKDKQNDKEGTRAPETTPEQQPSLMRRFLKSIPFIGGMIADALLGEENKGATIVSVEVTHGSPDGFRKDFIDTVTEFNDKLQKTTKNQAPNAAVDKGADGQTPKEVANPEMQASSPSTPEADKKTEETKDKKEEKSLGEILKEAIEKAAQDDKAAGNNDKMGAIKGIIEKYEKWNDKNGETKDPELKKLTDQCNEQINDIEKENQKEVVKEEVKEPEKETENKNPLETQVQPVDGQAKEEEVKENEIEIELVNSELSQDLKTDEIDDPKQNVEQQNLNNPVSPSHAAEGIQHYNGLITSVADSGTENLMNNMAKSLADNSIKAALNKVMDDLRKADANNPENQKQEEGKEEKETTLENIPTVENESVGRS